MTQAASIGAPIRGKAVSVPAPQRALAAQKDNIAQVSEVSRHSQTTFLALIAACVYSYLTIATTTDEALLSNSSATPLPIIQVNVPIVWFYWFAPLILTVLFIYFHLYLERFWRGISRLPLHHPDGRGLDDYIYPWLISSAVIRGEIRKLVPDNRTSVHLEAWLCLLLGWGLVPVVLLCYWARYVGAHDPAGSVLHVLLILLCSTFALHYLLIARNALKRVGGKSPAEEVRLTPTQRRRVALGLVLLGAVLSYLTWVAMRAPPERECRGSGADPACTWMAPGARLWKTLGVKPHADVREGRFVVKPSNWSVLTADAAMLAGYLEGQRKLVLSGRDLRGLAAAYAFMPGSRFIDTHFDFADLEHAVLTASRFDDVTLRNARLTDAMLQHVQLAGSRFVDVSAQAARLDHLRIVAAASGRPTWLSGDFSNASFDHGEGDGLQINTDEMVDRAEAARPPTRLIGATLRNAAFQYARLTNVDLGTAIIEDATLTRGHFRDTDFSGATVHRSFFNFSTFERCRFIDTDIQDSLFEEASFRASIFDHAPAVADAGSAVRRTVLRFQAVLATFDAATRLNNLHFIGAELRGARFAGTQLHNVLFDASDLSRAVFDGVDLGATTFRQADLSGADLSSARGLSQTALGGACGNADTRLPDGLSVRHCLIRPPPRGAR